MSNFAQKNAEYYLDGLQRWENQWEKCAELADYVEKSEKMTCILARSETF